VGLSQRGGLSQPGGLSQRRVGHKRGSVKVGRVADAGVLGSAGMRGRGGGWGGGWGGGGLSSLACPLAASHVTVVVLLTATVPRVVCVPPPLMVLPLLLTLHPPASPASLPPLLPLRPATTPPSSPPPAPPARPSRPCAPAPLPPPRSSPTAPASPP
jgi:hypothetical protein